MKDKIKESKRIDTEGLHRLLGQLKRETVKCQPRELWSGIGDNFIVQSSRSLMHVITRHIDYLSRSS